MIGFLINGYAIIGLITLLMLINVAKNTPEDTEDLAYNLGRTVAIAVLAWPYVILVWVFSWKIWLTPITLNWFRS